MNFNTPICLVDAYTMDILFWSAIDAGTYYKGVLHSTTVITILENKECLII